MRQLETKPGAGDENNRHRHNPENLFQSPHAGKVRGKEQEARRKWRCPRRTDGLLLISSKIALCTPRAKPRMFS
jgi:hypothetical protein